MVTSSFKWSGPPGSAEQVVELVKAQGRTLAESAALDTPMPWPTAYRDHLVGMLEEGIAALAVPYARFAGNPRHFRKVLQAVARDAFELRCTELAASPGKSGTA